MPVKKRKNKRNVLQNVERVIENDIEAVEKWVLERRKFLIKLALVIGLLLALLIFSYLFMSSGSGL